MFANWNLTRILTLAGGALCGLAGILFPPVAAFAFPIGAGLVGVAVKAPGTMSVTDLEKHGESVAAAVVPAVVNAAVGAAGHSPAQIGVIVSAAAKNALADTATAK